jgi:murein DD-endopeptidase MepM/ murein hydrolase activator NlpD
MTRPAGGKVEYNRPRFTGSFMMRLKNIIMLFRFLLKQAYRSAVGLVFLSACSALGSDFPARSPVSTAPAPPAAVVSVQVVEPPASEPSGVLQPSPTMAGTPPLEPVPTPVPTPSPLPHLCSPLQGVALEELAGLVSNPYHPPRPGSDDPHHGVDLADMDSARVARAGMGVQAALPGRVAGLVKDRFPYGNAVIVETELQAWPFLEELDLPAPLPLERLNTPLTCPPEPAPVEHLERLSVYLLYAHLLEPPDLEAEAEVGCGQSLGRIGSSGNALNPHLHLEARVGPSGRRFASLAHYTASAALSEMASYCTWRISGNFQMFDPFLLLASETAQK